LTGDQNRGCEVEESCSATAGTNYDYNSCGNSDAVPLCGDNDPNAAAGVGDTQDHDAPSDAETATLVGDSDDDSKY